MNTLDTNIFTDYVCPQLSGKIVDNILLVNKHYNAVVKADMKHLYSLFWKIEYGCADGRFKKATFKHIFKDGHREGKQLYWYLDGQLMSKYFYKEGKKEGKQLELYSNGQLYYKQLYKEGKHEGEQLKWYDNGQLSSKEFYKDGKLEGEQLVWYKDGQLSSKEFYKDGKLV